MPTPFTHSGQGYARPVTTQPCSQGLAAPVMDGTSGTTGWGKGSLQMQGGTVQTTDVIVQFCLVKQAKALEPDGRGLKSWVMRCIVIGLG